MMSNIWKRISLALMVSTAGASLLSAQNRTALTGQVTPVVRQAGTTVSPKSFFDGQNGTFRPVWQENLRVSVLDNIDQLIDAPAFEGASMDALVPNLPFEDLLVPVQAGEQLQIKSVRTEGSQEVSSPLFRETMQQARGQITGDWYPESPVVLGQRVIRKGQHYQRVRIYPIQVSSSGSTIRRSDAVVYSLGRIPAPQRTTGAGDRTYVANSVLQNGTWYKIGIQRDGVYKLDYNYMASIGIDVNSLDPRTIRIHGNANGMLPQEAGLWPYDDLVENNIFVQGENDGSFDQGDYVLFYAQGPHQWEYRSKYDRMFHYQNLYSDTAFVFLSFSNGNGARVPTVASAPGVTQTPTFTRKYAYHEKESFNPIGSGRTWIGETFDLTTEQTFPFSVSNAVSGSNIKVTARVGARSNSGSNFQIKENGSLYSTISITPTNTAIYASSYYRTNFQTFDIPANNVTDGSLDLLLDYSKPLTSSIGYLDYLEVEYQQRLNIGGSGAYFFHAIDGVGPGEVFQYNLSGGATGYRVWDVTDPRQAREINAGLTGSNISFAVQADSIKHFVAFNSSGHRTPVSARRISNQNLHGLAQAEYIMITNPQFREATEKLAAFHRNHFNRSVHVVEIQKIYNEFSSGAQDPAAIRDFIKMFYDRSLQNNSQEPRYVLLMGDGSYDYKGISNSPETNYIPTYQSRKSQRPTDSFTSDDFYGFLDDGEGMWGENAAFEANAFDILGWAMGDTAFFDHMLDVSVGRFPVSDPNEAISLVDKVIAYVQNPDGFGPWRNDVVLVADHKDADGSLHLTQADSYTSRIEDNSDCINIEKIYMDNYLMENTASGGRFPEGKEALLQALSKGSLLVNYTGHGGEIGWSNASILDISDINNLTNGNRLPAYVTATCEFGRWDDPARRSGAETLLLHEDGGAIAMFTTARVVYAGPNYELNLNFYKHVFRRDTMEDRMPTMGEVFQVTKNITVGGGINKRNFCLMGDPGMPLAYPELKAAITSINGSPVQDTVPDTLSALSLVRVEGEVRDDAGQFLSNFNGDVYVTVFDKPSRFTTKREPVTFKWQKNKIFNGKASVVNGRFAFEFVVPIDISYEDGLGKISLYLESMSQDGAGCNENLFIGGSNANSIVDDIGPELDLYMNDESFVEGGMVGSNPIMLSRIFDENGINTVGTGIGHELTAILDDDENNIIILNDFYTADKDSYKEGRIEYPFYELPDGEHSLEVKVWDVANNSSKARITFVVANDANMALGHVLNYPNPFSTSTEFMVEHNRAGHLLNVQIRIYTVSGKVVKTLDESFFAEGNLYRGLEWDGLDDYGDAIGRGVYVYQVLVRDEETGEQINTFEKLVLLR